MPQCRRTILERMRLSYLGGWCGGVTHGYRLRCEDAFPILSGRIPLLLRPEPVWMLQSSRP